MDDDAVTVNEAILGAEMSDGTAVNVLDLLKAPKDVMLIQAHVRTPITPGCEVGSIDLLLAVEDAVFVATKTISQ